MSGNKLLRISITDRCNLRCFYCMPESGVRQIPHSELLTYEEIELVCKTAMELGIKRFRLTGGEPLVRKELELLVEKISRLAPDDLALTTNGVLLGDFAFLLRDAGLKRITISLDTLQPEKFKRITKREGFFKVLLGIERARKAGLEPVKINTVLIRGWNDDEILDFVRFAQKENLQVRFIELMPTRAFADCKATSKYSSKLLITGAEAREKIEQEFGKLVFEDNPSGVAKIFRLKDGTRIGFITPVSEPFCSGCERLRLSSDGRLRLCLFDQKGIDLKSALRGEQAGEEKIAQIFKTAFQIKSNWERGEILQKPCTMHQLGG